MKLLSATYNYKNILVSIVEFKGSYFSKINLNGIYENISSDSLDDILNKSKEFIDKSL